MIFRNDLLEIEAIEKLPLVSIEPPHHRSLPPMPASRRPNHCSSKNSNDFCNKIGHKRKLWLRAKSQNHVCVETVRTLVPNFTEARVKAVAGILQSHKPLAIIDACSRFSDSGY
jgi:hypothetical protein